MKKYSISSGVIEVDLHGLNVEEAIRKVRNELNKAGASVYSIRLIHGFHGGTRIKEAIEDEFGFGREPKVKRIKPGSNPGITELVLREMFRRG